LANHSDQHLAKKLFAFRDGTLIAPYTVAANDTEHREATKIAFAPIAPEYAKQVLRALPELQDETLDNFLSCLAKAQRIEHQFSIPVSYGIATPEEIDDVDLMYRNHPNTHGYFQFSCVGFNSTRTQALFYVQQLAYTHKGGEFVLVIQSHPGEWIIKRELLRWSLVPRK
jgi:hypothetical protein